MTQNSSAQNGSGATESQIDLVAFAAYLREHKFDVTPEQVMSARKLILCLASTGELDTAGHSLSTWIKPVFCSSSEDEQEFLRLWDEFHPKPGGGGDDPLPPARQLQLSVLVLPVMLFALTLMTWLVTTRPPAIKDIIERKRKPTSPETPPPGSIAANENNDTNDKTGIIYELTHIEHMHTVPPLSTSPWRWWAFAPWPVLIWLGWTVGKKLTREASLERKSILSHYSVVFDGLPTKSQRIEQELGLRRTARSLRKRVSAPSERLDVDATVSSTVAASGFPTPQFSVDVEPTYVIFAERRFRRDHQAALAAELLEELKSGGLRANVYWFDGTPQHCFSDQGHFEIPTSLEQVVGASHDQRIIFVGNGDEFYDEFTGQLAAWTKPLQEHPHTLLLTTKPVNQWTRRERQLERDLNVSTLPISVTGLALLRRAFEIRPRTLADSRSKTRRPAAYQRRQYVWTSDIPPSPELIQQLLRDLELDLGPTGLQWLAALAVYPELNWRVTLHVGEQLFPNEYVQLLPRLAQLIWFRQGWMPKWLQSELIPLLTPEQEERVRHVLYDLFYNPGEGASEITSQTKTTLEDRIRILQEAVQDRDQNPDNPWNDGVFLEFMSGQRGSRNRSGFRLPKAILKALAPEGLLRQFGPKAWVGLTLAILCSVFLIWWSKPVPPSDDVVHQTLSADGSTLATVFKDGHLWVEKTTLVHPSYVIPAHPGVDRGNNPLVKATSIAWTTDGTHIVAGYSDGGIKLLDPETGDTEQTFEGHEGPITSLATSRQHLCSGSLDDTLRLWDLKTGKYVNRLVTPRPLVSFFAVGFARDERHIATIVDGDVVIWDIVTDQQTHIPSPTGTVTFLTVRMLPDRNLLTAESELGYYLIDMVTGEIIAEAAYGPVERPRRLGESSWTMREQRSDLSVEQFTSWFDQFRFTRNRQPADTNFLDTLYGEASPALEANSETSLAVRYKEPGYADLELLLNMAADDSMHRLVLAPNRKSVALLTNLGEIVTWNLVTEPTRFEIRADTSAPNPQVDRIGKHILYRARNNSYELRTTDDELIRSFNVDAADLSHSGEYVVTRNEKKVEVWNHAGGTPILTSEFPNTVVEVHWIEPPKSTGVAQLDELRKATGQQFIAWDSSGTVRRFVGPPKSELMQTIELQWQPAGFSLSPEVLYLWSGAGDRQYVDLTIPQSPEDWNQAYFDNPDNHQDGSLWNVPKFSTVGAAVSRSGAIEWDAAGNVQHRSFFDNSVVALPPASGGPAANVRQAGFDRHGLGKYVFREDGTLTLHAAEPSNSPLVPDNAESQTVAQNTNQVHIETVKDVISLAALPGQAELSVVFKDGSVQLFSLQSGRPVTDRMRPDSPAISVTAPTMHREELAQDVFTLKHADGSHSYWHFRRQGQVHSLQFLDDASRTGPPPAEKAAAALSWLKTTQEVAFQVQKQSAKQKNQPQSQDATAVEYEIDNTIRALFGTQTELFSTDQKVARQILDNRTGTFDDLHLIQVWGSGANKQFWLELAQVLSECRTQETIDVKTALVVTDQIVPNLKDFRGEEIKQYGFVRVIISPRNPLSNQESLDLKAAFLSALQSNRLPCEGYYFYQLIQSEVPKIPLTYSEWTSAGHEAGDAHLPTPRASYSGRPSSPAPQTVQPQPKRLQGTVLYPTAGVKPGVIIDDAGKRYQYLDQSVQQGVHPINGGGL
ncbi:MAG: hypothetical protein KDA66_04505 [Planctomycetaceae bacterium]|nr:hypothetical protein [Planctomycetaceae bacterium]